MRSARAAGRRNALRRRLFSGEFLVLDVPLRVDRLSRDVHVPSVRHASLTIGALCIVNGPFAGAVPDFSSRDTSSVDGGLCYARLDRPARASQEPDYIGPRPSARRGRRTWRTRSEERRVGKECGSRRWRCDEKKKKKKKRNEEA